MKNSISAIAISICAIFISGLAQAASLSDISNTRNETAIQYLYNNGIIAGYPDGTFRPDNSVNRAEILKILINANFNQDEIDNCIAKNRDPALPYIFFPDVPLDAWYAKYICLAKVKNIIHGYPDGTFKPGNTINKVEAIKILVAMRNYQIPGSVNEYLFDDTDNSAWYAPYLKVANDKGLLQENGYIFAPASEMTRAGISESIYRSLMVDKYSLGRFDPTEIDKITRDAQTEEEPVEENIVEEEPVEIEEEIDEKEISDTAKEARDYIEEYGGINFPSEIEPKELIGGQNSANGAKINIIFLGLNYSDIESFIERAKYSVDHSGEGFDWVDYANRNRKIYGLLGVEPFKSNKNKFNFWYLDYGQCKNSECADDLIDLADASNNLSNKYFVILENFHSSPAGSVNVEPTGPKLRMSTTDEDGNFEISRIGLLNHEFGHAFGDLQDVAYDTDASFSPNLAGDLSTAMAWWSNYIGDGCGADGIVDCREDCFENGECGLDEYETEVAYISDEFSDCFIDSTPVEGCSTVIERSQGPGLVTRKRIALRAQTKAECLASDDNCMFVENETVHCYDKKIDRLDTCTDLISRTKYQSENIWHDKINKPKFRPHINSIMHSSISTKYGPINEIQLCQKMEEQTGSAEGICTSLLTP